MVYARSLQSQGIALLEILVLIVIGELAILIALLLAFDRPSMRTMTEAAIRTAPDPLERADEARITAARTDVNNLMQALKLYKLDNRRYPSSAQGLQALVVKPTIEPLPPNWRPYLDKVPSDPWKDSYQYANPGKKGEIDVYSFGADGAAGGEGKNADIGSWE